MKHARDVMTAKPIYVSINDDIDAALELIMKNKFRSIPVVDEKNQPLGVFTEMALVKAIAVKNSQPEKVLIKDYVSFLQEAIYVEAGTLVKDFLSDVVKKGHARVLVISISKTIIGVISPRDILKLFTGDIMEKIKEEKERMVEIEAAEKKMSEHFFESVDAKDLFHECFELHPHMHILFNDKGMMLAMNKSFRLNLNYEDTDLSDLKLENLFNEDSHLHMLKEMAAGKLESKRENVELSFLKNAKNLIPVVCDLYSYPQDIHTIYLCRVQIKED